ncbi:MAG: thioredoxin domain-containing protein, partial [Rhizobiales bacterium]|nr:thioredoxin domain-containing protein [Hyphomicrobiales bacterium]
QRIEETVAWLKREMLTPSSAFAASYDADSEGIEGKFYVWSEADIDAALSKADARTFKDVYDVSAQGNWEETNILNRLKSQELLDTKTEKHLVQLRQKLYHLRQDRIPPGWDDKVLADWNGLTISALATAGLHLDEPDWIDLAAKAMTSVLDHLWKDGTLFHSYRDGKTHNYATAEDYANLITAAVALYQATAEPRHITTAEQLTQAMINNHWDKTAGGFFFSSELADNLIVRSKYAHDDATPNANGIMLGTLTDLHLITGNTDYLDYAKKLHDTFAANVQRVVVAHASFLASFDQHANPVQAVFIGKSDETKALRKAVIINHPALLIHVEDADNLPASHVAHGKQMAGGKPTLYLCTGQTCSLPITDPEQMTA